MRLDEDLDFTTLGWVKSELDETLRQARIALEAYAQDVSDTSQMRFCATYLHQVQGTLRMVELYGAAMVADEMEQLSKALLDGKVADREAAFAVLMRGIMQLPDYLERVSWTVSRSTSVAHSTAPAPGAVMCSRYWTKLP